MRILIVDDHDLVRKGVRSVLAQRNDIEVCGEAENGEEAVRQARECKPDVIVMDITMPKMNGLQATREILGILPGTAVLILSQHDSHGMIRQALNVGAKGYIDKAAISAQLLRGIDKVREGKLFFEIPNMQEIDPNLSIGRIMKTIETVNRKTGDDFRELAQSAAHVGSWEWTLGQPTPMLSRELLEIFGINPGNPDTASIWASRIDPADSERVLRLIEEGFHAGKVDFEYNYRHPEMGLRRLYCKGRRLQNESRMFGVVLDITDRKPD